MKKKIIGIFVMTLLIVSGITVASPTLDEIDSIAPRRGAYAGSHVTESVVNQILTSIDGLESMEGVIIIGATNRPDILDPSLLRPGRFDRLLLIPSPDFKSRIEIFKIHTKGMPISKDVSLKFLAEKTDGFSYSPSFQSRHHGRG